MTLGQGHDTLLSHKQCLFEVRTSNVTALLQDIWTGHKFQLAFQAMQGPYQ